MSFTVILRESATSVCQPPFLWIALSFTALRLALAARSAPYPGGTGEKAAAA